MSNKVVRLGCATILAVFIGVAAACINTYWKMMKAVEEFRLLTAPVVSDSSERDAVKILVIGNSINYQHMVPLALSQFIKEGLHKPAKVWQVLVPGQTLAGHWKTGVAQKKIAEGGPWDIVILQGATFEVFQDLRSLEEFAQKFDGAIKDAGAKTVLFETYADKLQVHKQKRVDEAYRLIGKQLNVPVVPVGQAYFYAAKKDEYLELYESDEHHPSQCGSFLISCVVYEYLFDKDPHGMPSNFEFSLPGGSKKIKTIELTKEQAQEIEDIAWEFYKANPPAVPFASAAQFVK